MSKKLTDKALANFEAKRDVWQEVLDGVREIKAGGEKQTKLKLSRAYFAHSSCNCTLTPIRSIAFLLHFES
ncbi:MAG TPA: hypothetical protein VN647_07945 [Nitrospira sp.]|nr:hypothetical protein [Nitrospira sp.]